MLRDTQPAIPSSLEPRPPSVARPNSSLTSHRSFVTAVVAAIMTPAPKAAMILSGDGDGLGDVEAAKKVLLMSFSIVYIN